MEDNQEPEQQNYDFTDDQRAEILKETFNVGPHMNECEEKSLENIIDSVIKAIKDDDYYNVIKCCIKKYWFTKQIEEWKYKENTKEAPEDDELMNIVKEDLKIRIANTMLELKKHNIDEKNIWFYQNGEYVDVKHNDDKICQVSEFNTVYRHVSPPYKPCFMNDKNDKNKLNGVCIYKHGKDENEDGKSKTKWIMACFKDDDTEPQCKITFKTDENDKITNVEIETAKDRNGDKSIYTISLNESGGVVKITKKGEKDANKNYAEEIKQLLFEGEINKVLTENIEYELDSQQKQVFDTIKNYIGIKIEKDNKKDEENKKEADNKNDNTIEDNITNQQSSTDLKAVNKRKWFGRYTDTDGHKYFSCCCFNIPLQ